MIMRKRDNYYFDTFVELVDYSCKAADLLNEIVSNYDATNIKAKMEEMHSIEHSADVARHKMMGRLLKEFITPIDREDIMAMADAIDTVTDSIEDVLMRLYMYNIIEVTEHAQKLAEIIAKCCYLLKQAFEELPNFRKSKKLHDLIVEINRLEESGDALYTEAIRDLYFSSKSYKEIVAWDNTYHYMEKCCDTCEDVSDVIENIIMKNT
jgi:predicted phosphate transport protein (TIGR00153 family)